MIRPILSSFLLLFLGITVSKAQNIVFEEDFESPPITSVWNDLGDTLWTGSSGCEQAARGTASDHNSTDVDFMASQNSSYFLGHNAQDSCGGFNTATILSDTFDFSGVDSLRFSCRYFLGDSIGWGPTTLEIEFMTSSDSSLIDTVFTDTSQWSSIDVSLPNSMIDDSVSFQIRMGGGEAVGVDDLKVMEYDTTTSLVRNEGGSSRTFASYPNPFGESLRIELPDDGGAKERMVRLIDMTGRVVHEERTSEGRSMRLNTSELKEGVYILEVKGKNGRSSYQRVMKK